MTLISRKAFESAAASQNEPHAILRLGIFYEEGFGVKASGEIAIAYYQKAADLGLTEGLVHLGRMYLGGSGGRPEVLPDVGGYGKQRSTEQTGRPGG